MRDTPASSVPPIDLFGPLPQGTTVLEASAGTGKTFTIAGLVARYVAEGVADLEQLLVVTFSRDATRELRDRVRARLVTARDGLQSVATARSSDDELIRHLATAPDDEVLLRRERLASALAAFDSATVVTTHEFCQRVLKSLGTAGDVDARAVLVEDLDDLVVEVVQDLYLRKWGTGTQLPDFSVAEALSLARTVVGDAQALLRPAGDVRWRFAQAVRTEVERRKRDRRLLGFDDLLTRLRQTLLDDDTGPAAQARLRHRHRVVLVDEFQDTDPVQWDILRLAFHGTTTLVLIGDPKQAIYAFRGADVHAYLAASDIAGQHATLARNWRSDPELLTGLQQLFRGAALGDPRIAVAPVTAAHAGRSLGGHEAPVQLRVLPKGAAPTLSVKDARDQIVPDVVNEVIALLQDAPVLTPRDGTPPRPVRPGDVAIIVRTNAQLELVHRALLAAGVPAVQRTRHSVFRTEASREWIVLLEALEQPHRVGRLRRLAVSTFVGWTADQLDAGDVDRLALRVRHWIAVFADRGVAALYDAVSRGERLPERLLQQVDGERYLTDLRHVGEVMHAAAMAGQFGLTACLEWLRQRVKDALQDGAAELGRRLDSDDEAVQVVTVHASKGLEFPVVHVPFGWDRHVGEDAVPLFHDEQGRRVRNVGGRRGAGFVEDQRRRVTEDLGEDLRLLYVAMTRAQAQVTVWWAPSTKNTPSAPLHRMLFTDRPDAGVPEEVAVPGEVVSWQRLSGFAVPGCLSVTLIPPDRASTWTRPLGAHEPLLAASFARDVDLAWRRTSYSALTAAAHDVPIFASEPEDTEKDDEPDTASADDAPGELADVLSPMHALAGGAAFGTLVHAVLEQLDPASADLRGALRTAVAGQSWRMDGIDVDVLTDALLPSLGTPLGQLADGRALRDVGTGERLTELEFEMPLRGGDAAHGESRLAEAAGLLRAHLPADDPLAGYADLLEDPVLGQSVLKGYLTGSIDVVLRIEDRYLVVDYKTNRLGPVEVPATAQDYRPESMRQAMLAAHYPLQALLYEVALHRFLRWRLKDYDPSRHLGGVLYLFLRGMSGPGVTFADGSIPGVFSWRPPADLVVALSDFLAVGLP